MISLSPPTLVSVIFWLKQLFVKGLGTPLHTKYHKEELDHFPWPGSEKSIFLEFRQWNITLGICRFGAAPKGSAGWWCTQSAHRSGAVHNSSQWAPRLPPWTSFPPLQPLIGLHLRALPDLNSLKEPSKQGSIYSCWYRRSWVISDHLIKWLGFISFTCNLMIIGFLCPNNRISSDGDVFPKNIGFASEKGHHHRLSKSVAFLVALQSKSLVDVNKGFRVHSMGGASCDCRKTKSNRYNEFLFGFAVHIKVRIHQKCLPIILSLLSQMIAPIIIITVRWSRNWSGLR